MATKWFYGYDLIDYALPPLPEEVIGTACYISSEDYETFHLYSVNPVPHTVEYLEEIPEERKWVRYTCTLDTVDDGWGEPYELQDGIDFSMYEQFPGYEYQLWSGIGLVNPELYEDTEALDEFFSFFWCDSMRPFYALRLNYVAHPDAAVETYETEVDAIDPFSESEYAVDYPYFYEYNYYTPAVLGYTFKGWTANGTDIIAIGDPIPVELASEDGVLTLTAVWEEGTLPDIGSNYLTFSSDNAFTIRLNNQGQYWHGTIYYSTDAKLWYSWSGKVTLPSAKHNGRHRLYMLGSNNTTITCPGNNPYYYTHFVLTGTNISCTGNIETLLDFEMVASGNHPPIAPRCFYYMFSGCTSLITVPELPATNLAKFCYASMFFRCTGLTTVPELPATTLAESCYYGMFNGCTSIKLSTTQTEEYSKEYRIPTSGTGTYATEAMLNMFANTGGTFTGTPLINTTYYIAPTPVDYTITYQSAYGTAPASKTVTVNEGESYALTADDLPTLPHYDIGGKYTYFTAWATQQFKGEHIGVGYEISGDITLHAVWSLKHTITFHSEHGAVPEPLIVTAYSDYFFETRVAMADLPVLEAEGYIFKGWSETKDGSYIIGSGYFINNDTNLYAVWEKVVEPEIAIYQSNGKVWIKKDLYNTDDTWKKKQVKEAYQQIGGEWVKIAPSE